MACKEKKAHVPNVRIGLHSFYKGFLEFHEIILRYAIVVEVTVQNELIIVSKIIGFEEAGCFDSFLLIFLYR